MSTVAFVPDGPRMLRMQGRVPTRLARRYVPALSRPQIISGVTRDASGNPLGGCTVSLFSTATNVLREVVTSDANGNYTFSAINDGASYYAVAYLTGSPDVSGTSVNTLVGQ